MNDEWLLPFKELIANRTGLSEFRHDNGSLSAHIQRRTSELALDSPEDYRRLAASDTREGRLELRGLVALFTVGESYFFRDKGQFKLLKEVILPELVERKSAQRELRVWSAGCSTGEEPYSLAILLDEILPDRRGWRLFIIGTDIREDFLEKARAGVYGEWSFRQVDESVKKRYFRKKRGGFALDAKIREMVSFSAIDLLEDPLPDYARGLYGFDLILCRNVFVYYNRQSVAKMLEKITTTLNAGGYLMTAHGELFLTPLGPLKPKVFAQSAVYVKRSAAPAGPAAEQAEGLPRMTPSIINRPAAVAAPRPLAFAQMPATGAEEVQALFKHGFYSRAAEKAAALLKQSPADFKMLYLSGAAYANLGEFEKAKEHLKRATAADRLAPEPYYLLALIAEEEGESESAKQALNKAIYLKKDFVAAYLELASIYEHEGGIEKAKRLRCAALVEVRPLPADSPVDMYDNATAGELAKYIEKMLGA